MGLHGHEAATGVRPVGRADRHRASHDHRRHPHSGAEQPRARVCPRRDRGSDPFPQYAERHEGRRVHLSGPGSRDGGWRVRACRVGGDVARVQLHDARPVEVQRREHLRGPGIDRPAAPRPGDRRAGLEDGRVSGDRRPRAAAGADAAGAREGRGGIGPPEPLHRGPGQDEEEAVRHPAPGPHDRPRARAAGRGVSTPRSRQTLGAPGDSSRWGRQVHPRVPPPTDRCAA